MRNRFAGLLVVSLLLTAFPVFAQQPTTKTFTTDDKSFTFDYPSSWSVEIVDAEQGPNAHLAIYNSIDHSWVDAADGVSILLSLPTHSFQIATNGAVTPKDVVAQSISVSFPVSFDFATAAVGSTPQPLSFATTIPTVTEFTVNGHPAAYGYIKRQEMGIDGSTMVIVVDLGNDYWVSMNVITAKDGLPALQKNEADILAIVKTMRFTAPAAVNSGNPDLPQVYSGLVGIWERGSITFDYPKDWYVSTPLAGFIVMANKQGNILNTLPQSGQFIASVQGSAETRAAGDPTEVFNDCNAMNSDLTAKALVQKILGRLTPAQLNQAGTIITQPQVTTSNGKEIVSLRGYQGDYEILQLFVDLGGGNIPSMGISTKKGEMAQFEKQLFAVAGTFEYTPKPCDRTATPQASS